MNWLHSSQSWVNEVISFLNVPERMMNRKFSMIELGDALEEMCLTEGWGLLERKISNDMDAAIRRMLSCPVEEVALVREQIKTMNGLKSFITQGIARSRNAKADMDEAEE